MSIRPITFENGQKEYRQDVSKLKHGFAACDKGNKNKMGPATDVAGPIHFVSAC